MLALLDSLFKAVSEGLQLISEEKARKWTNRYTETRLKIIDEEARGDRSDDAKIEKLYAQLAVLAQAAQNEFMAARDKS